MASVLQIRPARSELIVRAGRIPASAGGGAVDSVFGRTGAVTAQAGDYSAHYDAAGTSATGIAAHVAAADPHTGYLQESEVAETGASTVVRRTSGGNVSGLVIGTDIPALSHASRHRHGGADEVATATPGANAIPKAGAGGTLANAWLSAALASIGGLTAEADVYPMWTSASTAVAAKAVDPLYAGKPSAATYFYRVSTPGATAGTSGTVLLNRLHYYRFSLSRTITITTWGGVTSTTAAGTASYALYNSSGGLPSTLIQDFGDVSLSASGERVVTLGTPLVVYPGEYFWALWTSASVTWQTHTNSTILPVYRQGATRDVANVIYGVYESLVWSGNFPSTASGSLTDISTGAFAWWV